MFVWRCRNGGLTSMLPTSFDELGRMDMHVVLCCVCVCCVCPPPPDHPSAGPPSPGLPSTGPPIISLFFFPLSRPLSGVFSCLFVSLSRFFSFSFGGFLKRQDPQWPPGFHTTAREPKRAQFRVAAFKNTTTIPRKDPQEREEKMKIVAGEGKQA